MEIRCAINGVDDNTKIEELVLLSRWFPWVEWGILFSRDRKGTPRYPSSHWLKGLQSSGLRLSAHLCGEYARDIIRGGDLWRRHHGDFVHLFSRMQLNLPFEGAAADHEELAVALASFPRLNSVIFQTRVPGVAAEALTQEAAVRWRSPSYTLLFDPSGGRGELPFQWPTIGIDFCGYAGGLSPLNIEREISRMKLSRGGLPFWVDVESGVREEDEFNTGKALEFLLIVEKFWRKPTPQ